MTPEVGPGKPLVLLRLVNKGTDPGQLKGKKKAQGDDTMHQEPDDERHK